MFKSEYRIGRVWGIPLKIHISLLLLLIYLATRAGWHGGLLSIVFVLVLELFVFGSIALHELGHSFIAIRKGCRVREITLMFIGGAAKMEQLPSKPFDEFLMAIAGPAVSLTLGIISFVSGLLIMQIGGFWEYAGTLIFYAGIVNLLLAGFNLIPAFPMDGGRVFRALMTPRHGRLKATYYASRIGRAVAVIFFIVGLFGIESIPLFQPGNPFLVLISVFIFITADREYRMIQFEELMRKRGFRRPWPGTPQPPPPEAPDDDTVLISPPPYAKGPNARSNLHHEKIRP